MNMHRELSTWMKSSFSHMGLWNLLISGDVNMTWPCASGERAFKLLQDAQTAYFYLGGHWPLQADTRSL